MVTNSLIILRSADTSNTRRHRRRPLLFAGLGLVALVSVFGSTYAANIALNSGSNIEFGQGSQQTVTCDNSVTVTPAAVYDAAADTWGLTVYLSNIDVASCITKTFTVSTWTTAGTLHDVWSFNFVDDYANWGSGYGDPSTPGNDDWYWVNTDSLGSYDVTLVSTLDAKELGTVTVESSN